ncbi:MAG: hypothetical protein ACE366_30390 [Bradymonadia bacterium]
MRITGLWPLLVTAQLWACGGAPTPKPSADPLQLAFEAAVLRASDAYVQDVRDDLRSVPEDTEQVQVVAMMSAATQSRFYGVGVRGQLPEEMNGAPFVLWVTLEPELRDFCTGPGHRDAPRAQWTRLRQYLGMKPPQADEPPDVLVYLTVHPLDLIRPCRDPETFDTACTLGVATTYHRHIPAYAKFFEGLAGNGYPFTGLGYTFDWGRDWSGDAPIPAGASEYILRPGGPYTVRAVHSVTEDCNGPQPRIE